MVLPLISTKGLPGNRVEAYLDGIIPSVFILEKSVYLGLYCLDHCTKIFGIIGEI